MQENSPQTGSPSALDTNPRTAFPWASMLLPTAKIRRLFEGMGARSKGIPLNGSATILTDTVLTETVAELAAFPQAHRHYQTIVAVDITGFGAREEHVQNYVRAAMYTTLRQAFADADVPWPAREWRDDRGDGALLILPPDIVDRVLDPLVPYLHAGLRRHNRVSSEPAQIMLRMAVHSGYVYRDDHGLSGEAIVYLCRLLDAPAFKDAVRGHRAPLGVVVSQYIYDSVVRNGRGLIDPDDYSRIPVVNKETRTEAWLHLPSRAEAPL